MKKFNVGDLLSVRIPRNDRAVQTLDDYHALLWRRLEKSICFIASCVQGVLKSCYQESDLELYLGSSSSNDVLKVKGWKDEKLNSLHEAAKRQNPCNKFYGDNCSCQKGCSSR